MNIYRTHFRFSIIEHLKNRSALYQTTSENLPTNCAVYCGFDPTAPSLHLGNFISILNLVRFQQENYQPIALVGGATVQLGDPSGKKTERTQLEIHTMNQNQELIKMQIQRVYQNITKSRKMDSKLLILNNADFYRDQNIISFISQVGNQFRMNALLSKDHIKQRLDDSDNGLSLKEFFYTILQSYDFAYLHKQHNCLIQIGGSDQWGNITNGCDYIRKTLQKPAYGLTTPLLVDKSGNKFGKSEGNALFLEKSLTSIDQIRQYIINLPDDMMPYYLKMLTFIPLEEIQTIQVRSAEQPTQRIAQNTLSEALIKMIHSVKVYKNHLFTINTKELCSMPKSSFEQIIDEIDPTLIIPLKTPLTDKLIKYISESFSVSISQINREISMKGLYINGETATKEMLNDYESLIIHRQYIILRSGKKNYRILKFIN